MAGARVDPLGSGDPATLGRYEMIGRLASGGMGRIYLARSADGQLAAVKTLLAEGVVSDVDRRRFTREVELAQRVDSAFTARVREADPGADRPWMAIDYIAAPSLSELVRTAGVLPASAVRWLAAGTAEALVTLHREGIIHRDVKPQNILLPLPGPRVIDFGISHANDLTRTSLTLGTIAFTSPEQARGEPSTEASDVYSLGATLFHLALGRPPYRADSDTLGLLARVQRGELDLDGLPKELATLIRPCLAADPGQRPVPAEMLARFRQSLAGLPVSQGGSRWLPPRWTALITAYERQGQDFARGAGAPDASPSDLPTGMVPPPRATVMYTQERERARREQAALAERAERDRARAAQAGQERQREEERQRQQERLREEEQQRKEAQERERAREQEEARRREREAAEQRARERAGRQAAREAAARQRAARSPAAPAGAPRPATARTRAGASARTPARSPGPSPAAPKKSSSSTVVVLLVLAVIAFFVWQNTKSDDGSSGSGGGGTHGSSSGSGGDTVTGAGSSRDAPLSGPTPGATPDPTPDAEDAVFRAVSAGDCLDAHDDGYGSWSADAPRSVDCDAADAYLLVTSAQGGLAVSACPTGPGRSYWHHSGSRPEFGTRLCVSRRFRVGECFVAKRDGTGMRDGRLMTVWGCSKDTVPAGYDTILRITGRWRAEPSYPPGYCAESRNDRAYYYTFEVDDGKTVLCTKPV
ncbi:serine/threonine protein kinase [Streptomyces sp. NBC_00178]|uniref:serine/threonine-protein kinase n=1 Tax=Streptomyces sp. NBC_00178 TaxID=2975672 RepID=UPI002E2817FF|nr:serine/threonine-protein kinase [Streptomyces sp. NBC_00178]